jgi:hypothetical protein
MAIPRSDSEARTAVEIGRGIEIADGVNDVVETAGHGHDRLGLLEDLVGRLEDDGKILQSQHRASTVQRQKSPRRVDT